jgi:hypothetical protein
MQTTTPTDSKCALMDFDDNQSISLHLSFRRHLPAPEVTTQSAAAAAAAAAATRFDTFVRYRLRAKSVYCQVAAYSRRLEDTSTAHLHAVPPLPFSLTLTTQNFT